MAFLVTSVVAAKNDIGFVVHRQEPRDSRSTVAKSKATKFLDFEMGRGVYNFENIRTMRS